MRDHDIALEKDIVERIHFQNGVTLVAGIVLVVTPFVLAITPPEGTNLALLIANFVISGGAAIILGAAALFYFRKWEEWLDIALGVWLVASPWILGFTYSQAAMWTAIVCGVVIAAMGTWRTTAGNGERVY
ncbi:hypothetical protein ABIE69_003235 [Rhodobacteraceae bacterium MBR-64]|jgi:hypothetical protein